MIDANKQLQKKLSNILPCYFEMFVDSTTPTPCITYLEANNSDKYVGTTMTYSDVSYYIKVWATSVADIVDYSIKVDKAMKQLGYRRASTNDLVQDKLICKVMLYNGLALEK